MTEPFGGQVPENVEQTPEQELKAAEAAFANDAPVKDEAPAEVVDKPAIVPEVVADPWDGVPSVVRQTLEGINGKLGVLDSMNNEFKTTTGRVASIQRELAAAKAAAKTVAVAPTPAQIAEASKTQEKWNKQKEDFPEWAEATEERFAAERAETLKQIPKVDVDAIKTDLKTDLSTAMAEAVRQAEVRAERRARAFARVDAKYETWEDDILTPNGGYKPEFAAWNNTQPLEIQALAASENPRDAIRMLDLYYEHRKAEATRQKNQQRLETAIPAKGTQAQRQPTIDERSAAEKAFASA